MIVRPAETFWHSNKANPNLFSSSWKCKKILKIFFRCWTIWSTFAVVFVVAAVVVIVVTLAVFDTVAAVVVIVVVAAVVTIDAVVTVAVVVIAIFVVVIVYAVVDVAVVVAVSSSVGRLRNTPTRCKIPIIINSFLRWTLVLSSYQMPSLLYA